jgi:hypothetical protein
MELLLAERLKVFFATFSVYFPEQDLYDLKLKGFCVVNADVENSD